MVKINFVESLRSDEESTTLELIKKTVSIITEKYGYQKLKEYTNIGAVYLRRGCVYPELLTLDHLIRVLEVGGYRFKVVDFYKKEYTTVESICAFLIKAKANYIRTFEKKEYFDLIKSKGLISSQVQSQIYSSSKIKIETLVGLADIFVYDIVIEKYGSAKESGISKSINTTVLERAKICVNNVHDLSNETLREELIYFCNFILSQGESSNDSTCKQRLLQDL